MAIPFWVFSIVPCPGYGRSLVNCPICVRIQIFGNRGFGFTPGVCRSSKVQPSRTCRIAELGNTSHLSGLRVPVKMILIVANWLFSKAHVSLPCATAKTLGLSSFSTLGATLSHGTTSGELQILFRMPRVAFRAASLTRERRARQSVARSGDLSCTATCNVALRNVGPQRSPQCGPARNVLPQSEPAMCNVGAT